ncbi:hypothetical protein SPILM97S_02630 [Streptomyces pilosus]
MSISQAIAAWVTSLNRGSHVSGDTCHMMPRSLARRAAGEGPHRAGVDPVRPCAHPGGDGRMPGIRDGGVTGPTPMGPVTPPRGRARTSRRLSAVRVLMPCAVLVTGESGEGGRRVGTSTRGGVPVRDVFRRGGGIVRRGTGTCPPARARSRLRHARSPRRRGRGRSAVPARRAATRIACGGAGHGRGPAPDGIPPGRRDEGGRRPGPRRTAPILARASRAPRKPPVTDARSCPYSPAHCRPGPVRSAPVTGAACGHPVSGTGSGRFSIAAAITSGNRSGVQANAGTPNAASAAACSLS